MAMQYLLMLFGLGDIWKRVERTAGTAFDQMFDNPVYFAVAALLVIFVGIWLLKSK